MPNAKGKRDRLKTSIEHKIEKENKELRRREEKFENIKKGGKGSKGDIVDDLLHTY
mgnify:CR=1 FL=1